MSFYFSLLIAILPPNKILGIEWSLNKYLSMFNSFITLHNIHIFLPFNTSVDISYQYGWSYIRLYYHGYIKLCNQQQM